MEDSIADLIDLLDSSNLKEIQSALNSLDVLLSQLLPEIVKFHKASSAPTPTNNNSSHPPGKLSTFIVLQDNFQYNIASHLINFYKYVLANNTNVDEESLLTCNRLLQGLLLLHPNSRNIFNRTKNMKVILDILEASDEIGFEATISVISTLIHILLKDFRNFRKFEENNGCSILIKSFKLSSFDMSRKSNSKDTKKTYNQQDLNFKIIEFLIFYLIDETTIANATNDASTPLKSIKQKSDLFKSDFPDIDSLIENLNELKEL
ncbi:cell division protein Cdc14 [Scheffersomyces xylosifermentans]|uniref:cell division protein Cdc14 n=1 Tax=Scheffersomyces xylosifermentans TaxID=1304137 RepID=UPI00315C6B62